MQSKFYLSRKSITLFWCHFSDTVLVCYLKKTTRIRTNTTIPEKGRVKSYKYNWELVQPEVKTLFIPFRCKVLKA